MTNDLNIFFREVWQEFNKIIWPSRKDFLISVFATLIIIVLFSFYLGFLDLLIAFVVNRIICILV